jgi:hypothetical protein
MAFWGGGSIGLTLQIYPIGGLDWSDMAQEADSYPCPLAPKARKPLLLMDLPNTGREGSKFWKLRKDTFMEITIYQSGEKIKVCENCHPLSWSTDSFGSPFRP